MNEAKINFLLTGMVIQEIIDKIVKLDPEMEDYREILLTKNLVELNKIHQELKGN